MTKRMLIFSFFLVVIVSSFNAQDKGPVAVSPASEIGIAQISTACPTFSWTTMDWAEVYRVEIFYSTGKQKLAHQEITRRTNPVLVKEIPGAATSWTPSIDEQLPNNRIYVWYVQAIDPIGYAMWSEGEAFLINQAAAFAPFENVVSEALDEAGVSTEVIHNVLDHVRSNISQDVIVPQNTVTPISVQGTEGTNDTFYGSNAGFSDTPTSSYNSFFGTGAGYTTSTGQQNSFLGYHAGYTNDGYANTFLGHYSGRLNTTGGNNIFSGAHSGSANTTGSNNIFSGSSAGYSNISGSDNVFSGHRAGFYNTLGIRNTFIGSDAGFKNSEGNYNTFIGSNAGYNNTAGGNIFIGDGAGYSSTISSYNVFMGYHAGYDNTTGEYNLFLGYSAGSSNDAGDHNVFLGYRAGYFNVEGDNNVYLGHRAGDNATGSGNVFLGFQAGYNETGSNLLYIDNSNTSNPLVFGDFSTDTLAFMGTVGVGTKTPAFPMEMKKTGTNASIVVDRTDGATNYINATDSFGNFGTVTNHPLRLVTNSLWRARINSDNSLQMRNGATCTAAGVWTNASSRELKANIRSLSVAEAVGALESLDPVKYTYKTDQDDEYVGFIAEDVPALVASKDRRGMSAMDVVGVLTKVLQEQQRMLEKHQQTVEEHKELVKELKKSNEELKTRIAELENKILQKR